MADEYESLLHTLGLGDRTGTHRHPASHLDMLLNHEDKDPSEATIWDLICKFPTPLCSDPRDRLFGLLSMADLESRATFSPDYTKSAASVLLQLLEHLATNDWKHVSKESGATFYWAYVVIVVFGLGPHDRDIAAMRDRRRTFAHDCGPFSDVSATRVQQPSFIRQNDPCSFYQLPRDLVDMGSRYIVLDYSRPCTVSKNDTGGLVAPLRKQRMADNSIRHDFSKGQEGTPEGIKLHTPDGSVAGLANKQIQHGDTILFFECAYSGGSSFSYGLIVRRLLCKSSRSFVARIIGQCIVDPDFEIHNESSDDVCRDVVDDSDDSDEETWVEWKALMSPEDLLVFVAQDLNLIHSRPSRFHGPVVDISIDPTESRKRLITRVTSEEFSSYAIATLRP